MSERNALLPCPFCGWESIACIGQEGIAWCQCPKCSCDGPTEETKPNARSTWNHRATSKIAAPEKWLREFIAERRRLSFNLELHAHETAATNFFLDELEKAWRAAEQPSGEGK